MNDTTYGITCFRITAGLSTVTGFAQGANVIDTVITGMTGGPLYIGGATLNADNGSLVAKGAIIYAATSCPISIGGPAAVYFTATGAAAVVSIMQKLREGYSGGPV